MQTRKFSLRARFKSFNYAFAGLQHFFSTQHNAVVHAIATAIVIAAAFLIQLPPTQLLILLIVTGLVWMAELFNTAIEKLCDMVCPQQHPQIKFIKDVSAAAVLVIAIIALVTGCIIFIPVLI